MPSPKALPIKPKLDPSQSFAVTLETEIGRVHFGDGTDHPFQVAMGLIAKHQLDNGPDWADATYRFPGESRGTVVITVKHDGLD